MSTCPKPCESLSYTVVLNSRIIKSKEKISYDELVEPIDPVSVSVFSHLEFQSSSLPQKKFSSPLMKVVESTWVGCLTIF